jgi:hypothetical protein
MRIQKKNILIPGTIAGMCWIGVSLSVFLLKPEGWQPFLFFFALLFLALYGTFSLLFVSRRRGLLISCSVIGFLMFRLFELDTLVNTILLLSLCLTTEVYFFKRKQV